MTAQTPPVLDDAGPLDEQPLVSVVLATFNMAEHLDAAISSVLHQTYPKVELVVVDDGSTDDTPRVLDRYSGRPDVRIIRQRNAGQTVAKNAGVQASRGTLIAFCDADDLWVPDKLARQVPVLCSDPGVGVVYSGVTRFGSTGLELDPPRSVFQRGWVTEALFLENFVPFGTAVVRRSALGSPRPFNESLRMAIDWELWLRISLDFRFEYVDAPLYRYRVWDGQMSKNWNGRYDSAFKIMDTFLAEHPGKISEATRRRAYSLTFTNRARARLARAADYRGAFADAARSISAYPLWIAGWRTLFHIAISPVRPRKPWGAA
jgi:glycosyltransferase involved in cell wall biosynthesis